MTPPDLASPGRTECPELRITHRDRPDAPNSGSTNSGPTVVDPFSLPPSTSSQFILLAAAVLSATAYVADQAAAALFAPDGWQSAYRACDRAADVVRGASDVQVTATHAACLSHVSHGRLAIVVGALLALLVAFAAGYWVVPRHLVRRDGLRPVNPAQYPAAAREIDAVLARAAEDGRPRRVRVLMALLCEAPTGRAFGRAGQAHRYTVRLNRSLVARRTEAGRLDLRAVLRHELAHVTNGDVELTSLAVLSTWAAGLVAVPLLAVAAWREPSACPRMALEWSILFATIVLVRASVIRTREHYADVRAAQVNVATGDEPFRVRAFDLPAPPAVDGWFRTLAALVGRPLLLPPAVGRWFRALAVRVRRPLLLHPSVERRREVVNSPDLLMTEGFAEAFATGLVAGLMLPLLAEVTDLLSDDYGVDVACLAVAAFCTTVLGTTLSRSVCRSLALGVRPPRGVGPALGLALGLLGGQYLSPGEFSPWRQLLAVSRRGAGASAVLLVLMAWLFVRCVVVAAAGQFDPAGTPAGSGSRWARRAGLVVGSLALGSAISGWLAATFADPSTLLSVVGVVSLDPVRHLPFVFAAGYLLLVRRRSGADHHRGLLLAAVPAGLFCAGASEVLLPAGKKVSELFTVQLLPGEGADVLAHRFTTFLTGTRIAMVAVAFVVAIAVHRSRGWVRTAQTMIITILVGAAAVSVTVLIPIARNCGPGACSTWSQPLDRVGSVLVVVE